MRSLTTTSYAILGWLEVKSWSSYELAAQMRRNLRFFWPRVESRLYDEPKNLVEHGLASAAVSYAGKRRRTTYEITGAGRAALREWQGTTPDLPALEFDGLVHLFFGATASPAELGRAAATAADLADLVQEQGRLVAGQYLAGAYPFPDRAHFSGIAFDFLWSLAGLMRAWSLRTQDELANWGDSLPSAEKEGRAFAIFREALGTPRPEKN